MNDDPQTIRNRRAELLRAIGHTPEVNSRTAKADAQKLLNTGTISYTKAERRIHRKVLLTSLQPLDVDELAVELVLAGRRRYPDGTLMRLTEDERIEIDRRARAAGETTWAVARILCTSMRSVLHIEKRAAYHDERSA
jgi:hypothetical protein